MRMLVRVLFVVVIASAAAAVVPAVTDVRGRVQAAPPRQTTEALPDATALARLSARLAPVDLEVDVSHLPASERAALTKLIQAAKVMDPIYLRQVWAGNAALLVELAADTTTLGKARLRAFLQNKGPWSRLDDERPFLPGVDAKPPAGSFYPPDSTKEEVEAWMKALPPAAHVGASGFFTTIRRGPAGKLEAVPYGIEHQSELGRAAALLRDAATLTQQPTLRAFLEKRAAAFLSNDYHDSDVAWMRIDASVEPTIGPYEVYEDGWFSAKAAFEAFITVRDDVETAKLAKLGGALQDIEDHLPIEAAWRNPKLGALAPIRVVNSLFSSGDGNRGVQTAAFNLPNDERIAKEMGTKRTMLKNIQEAKFRVVLRPISRLALSATDEKAVSFEGFFSHILMHELMHGLGPHEVVSPGAGGAVGGAAAAAPAKARTVRAALQETYGALEEAKADISGLFALQYLVDKGVLDKALERTMYPTFLASTFRSIRFGLKEAHGQGIALQLSTLLDAGAFTVGKDGRFSVNGAKTREAARALTAEIMTIQATGDKARAAELLRTRAVIRPEVQRVLDRLSRVPVDIEPRFVTAEKLLAAGNQNR
ncbi:MAG: hypothetical protein ABUL77_04010 [Bacteroidota bacterium]